MAPPNLSQSLRPEITCAGAKLSAEEHDAVDGLRITDGLGVPAYARLTFSVLPESKLTISPKLGDDLSIRIEGSGTAEWTVFDGVVVGLGVELGSGQAQNVIVEAYDKLYMLGRSTHAITYLDKTPSDVVKELAGKVDLAVDIASGFGTAVRPAAYQYGTAYAYIDTMVRESGYEWHVSDKKLHVSPRVGATDGGLKLTIGDDIISFSARSSASDFVNEVTVTGWDVKEKKAIVGSATSDGKGTRSTMKSDVGATVKNSNVGGTTALSIPRPVADQKEATMLATGIMHRREASLLRARGEVVPAKGVIPGSILEIEGLIGDWDGKYYVTEVEHVWGANTSLRTFFEVGAAEPESLVDLFGGSGSATLDRMLGGLTIGIVTNNDDPDGLNRVKLKLPYLSDDQDTAWARVLQPGSGKDRGWTVVPELDDEVLVGFEHGSIDHPYVLGGLVNGKDKPKYTGSGLVKDGKVGARIFNSRLGHEIYIADGSGADEQFVRINTAGKEATVFIGKEKIDVEAKGIPIKVFNEKGSMEITKSGDITIKGNKITLDATTDIILKSKDLKSDTKVHTTVTAGGEVKISGRLGGTLDGGLTAKVKGGMVNIN